MKHIALVFLLMMVTACGFTPVHSPSGKNDVDVALSGIDIAIIPNREGQYVRNELIDRINYNGYATNPTHRLIVSPIKERSVEIGLDKDDEASRAQLRESTTMRLIDIQTNKVVLQRSVNSVTSYNILAGQFTTYVNEEDAREQALSALANNIVTELELYFRRTDS